MFDTDLLVIGSGVDCQTCFSCELECPTGAIRIRPFRRKRVQPW